MTRPFLLLTVLIGISLFVACTHSDDTDDPVINYQISVSSNSNTIAENGGSITLTVSLDKTNEGEAIDFSLTLSGQAREDIDYELSGDNVIAGGSQSASITIAAIDDSDVEGDESITISLQASVENVTVANSTVNLTITDDDEEEEEPGPCEGTTDTYDIDLDPTNCTVDIEAELGVSSMYNEEVSGGDRVISSNAIPNHNVGQFPNNGNPHTITEINSSYTVEASPTANSSVTYLTNTNTGMPLYRFGILYNGILLAPIAAEFFTNTETGEDNTDWNENALSSEIRLGTDCNNSHVFPSGMYHHHATPSAFVDAMNINGSTPVQIGWAADGFPIYYKYGNKNGSVAELTSSYQLKTEERGGNGTSAPSGCPDGTYTQDYEYSEGLGDLDECNGYNDPQLGYMYIITDTYPSIPRCFAATPSNDFRNN